MPNFQLWKPPFIKQTQIMGGRAHIFWIILIFLAYQRSRGPVCLFRTWQSLLVRAGIELFSGKNLAFETSPDRSRERDLHLFQIPWNTIRPHIPHESSTMMLKKNMSASSPSLNTKLCRFPWHLSGVASTDSMTQRAFVSHWSWCTQAWSLVADSSFLYPDHTPSNLELQVHPSTISIQN